MNLQKQSWKLHLNLSDLRPIQPTGLSQLSNSLRGKDAVAAAMPSALSEAFLLSIARDLRGLEEAEDGVIGDDSANHMAAPMMLVMHLLLATKPNESKLSIGENALFSSLRVYQWAVEREIVKRIIGKGGFADDCSLLEGLDKARMVAE